MLLIIFITTKFFIILKNNMYTTFIALICHYNNPEGLEKSLLSIREDFPVDVLIVDDGSSIKPNLEHLESIYKNGKIFLELLPQNVVVEEASNLGIKKITESGYKITGRLDCAALNHRNRYKKQSDYLAQNPAVQIME